jgi:hypothetical protein
VRPHGASLLLLLFVEINKEFLTLTHDFYSLPSIFKLFELLKYDCFIFLMQ